jgi:hypothetical protein
MSNNNKHSKPAMTAIVSAAQKSVNNTNNVNQNKNNINILNSPIPQSNVLNLNTTPIHKSTDSVGIKNISNAVNDILNNPQKNIKTAQENIKTSFDAVTKKQEEILKTIPTEKSKTIPTEKSKTIPTEKPKTIVPVVEQPKTVISNTQQAQKSDAVVKPAPQVKSVSETEQKSDNNVFFNRHIASIMCESVRNAQKQTHDLAEKLLQRHQTKKKSLTQLQTVTCDHIHALSNTCIDVAQKSIKNVNPLDFIKNQTKAFTEIQKIYANMVTHFSATSLEMVKQNYSFNWFYDNKK